MLKVLRQRCLSGDSYQPATTSCSTYIVVDSALYNNDKNSPEYSFNLIHRQENGILNVIYGTLFIAQYSCHKNNLKILNTSFDMLE